MTCGYGLPPGHVFEAGQVLCKPDLDGGSDTAIVVAAVLPWKGEEGALLLWYERDREIPACPWLESAEHARDWWLPLKDRQR